MNTEHLLKNRERNFLKELARELLLNENSELDQTISYICQKFNISEKEVKTFVNFLYRRGFLVKYDRGQKYSLTLNGVSFLLNLVESCYFSEDLEADSDGDGNEY
jgi:predicted transcriptional regulator